MRRKEVLMAIKTIDEYLYRIQEIYSPSIVLTSIHGDFQSDWTDCFNSKCSKETNKYDLSYCKTNCIITAATTAMRQESESGRSKKGSGRR